MSKVIDAGNRRTVYRALGLLRARVPVVQREVHAINYAADTVAIDHQLWAVEAWCGDWLRRAGGDAIERVWCVSAAAEIGAVAHTLRDVRVELQRVRARAPAGAPDHAQAAAAMRVLTDLERDLDRFAAALREAIGWATDWRGAGAACVPTTAGG